MVVTILTKCELSISSNGIAQYFMSSNVRKYEIHNMDYEAFYFSNTAWFAPTFLFTVNTSDRRIGLMALWGNSQMKKVGQFIKQSQLFRKSMSLKTKQNKTE